MTNLPPRWLDENAKAIYKKIVPTEDLTPIEANLFALLANELSTYQSALAELNAHAGVAGTLLDSKGKPHGTLAIMRAASGEIIKLVKALSIKSDKSVNTDALADLLKVG